MSNEIALAQVQQIQMLRQLVMAQMNSQNTAAANQLNSQTQSQLAAQAIIGCAAAGVGIARLIHATRPATASTMQTVFMR